MAPPSLGHHCNPEGRGHCVLTVRNRRLRKGKYLLKKDSKCFSSNCNSISELPPTRALTPCLEKEFMVWDGELCPGDDGALRRQK